MLLFSDELIDKCIKIFSVLISNIIHINSYNPYFRKLQLFEILTKF